MTQSGILGITVLVALLGLSMAGLALAVEQVLVLRSKVQSPPDLLTDLEGSMKELHFNQAEWACQQKPSYIAEVVQAGLGQREFGYPAVEKAMEDASQEHAHRLLRRVDHLGLIGNLAPMLGLLGTVYGLVLAFGEIAQTDGSADVGQLAQGIYTALGTTVLGLVVAIPALACYAIFRGRIENIANDVNHQAEKLFLSYRRQQHALTSAPPASESETPYRFVQNKPTNEPQAAQPPVEEDQYAEPGVLPASVAMPTSRDRSNFQERRGNEQRAFDHVLKLKSFWPMEEDAVPAESVESTNAIPEETPRPTADSAAVLEAPILLGKKKGVGPAHAYATNVVPEVFDVKADVHHGQGSVRLTQHSAAVPTRREAG